MRVWFNCCSGCLFLSSVTCSFAATDADTLVMPLIWLIAPLGAMLTLVFALIFYKGMMKSSEGNDVCVK